MRYEKSGGGGTATRFITVVPVVLVLLLAGCSASRQASWHWDKDAGKKYCVRQPDTSDRRLASRPSCRKPFYFLDDVKYLDQDISHPLKNAKIVVNKTKRKLYLLAGNRVVRIYPVSLGFDPVNDKVRQGDGRTPEGKFYVCTKNPQSRFHLSLGISYPTIEDAERGLKQGLITRKEYDQIAWAIKKGKRPPWSTRLGGAICIHGGGVAWNWTQGCIALNNRDMEELFKIVPTGTPVIIEKLGTRTAALEEVGRLRSTGSNSMN